MRLEKENYRTNKWDKNIKKKVWKSTRQRIGERAFY